MILEKGELYHMSFASLYTFTYTVLPSPVSCVGCPSLYIYIYSSPFSSIMCHLPVCTHLNIQFSLLQYHVPFVRLYTFTYTVLPSPVSCVVCPCLHIYVYSSPFSSIMCRLSVFTRRRENCMRKCVKTGKRHIILEKGELYM
jgi:hypothetical protein